MYYGAVLTYFLTIYNHYIHRTSQLLKDSVNYFKGFLEIITYDQPRYSFVIKKLDLFYIDNKLITKITFSPLGCYRPRTELATHVVNQDIIQKFKFTHSKMIIEITNLEKVLNLNKKEHIDIYTQYVGECLDQLKNETL